MSMGEKNKVSDHYKKFLALSGMPPLSLNIFKMSHYPVLKKKFKTHHASLLFGSNENRCFLPAKQPVLSVFFMLICVLPATPVLSQSLKSLSIDKRNGVTVRLFEDEQGNTVEHKAPLPLLSFLLDGEKVTTAAATKISGQDQLVFHVAGKVEITYRAEEGFNPGWKGQVTFRNTSENNISLANIVPFGESAGHVYITGKGNHGLSRTHLFRPGYAPVNVIVPDNAWELGYAGIGLNETLGLCALTRRTAWEKAQRKRFETLLEPGGTVNYDFYADFYQGDWQQGLRRIFQERYLYDVEAFDETLYDREDLHWIRDQYVIHLMMSWDRWFYDRESETYTLPDFIRRGNDLYGGDDIIGIWPTWPVLGLDQRNQWDMFRDLPGGLEKVSALADSCRALGTKFFICYNPWDQSTRDEDHFQGMKELIRQTSADGMVLDTRGESSNELQEAADAVKPGVIMYSEGMAVPKNMQGIVSGRVHNALYYPPLLNLNKFIRPEFAIFRVAELKFDRIRREYALSMFNGYGTEINIFRPGRPEWMEEDYRFLGRTARVLRENSANFNSSGYRPLIKTLKDSIYVNFWPGEKKSVYTIFSLIPEGFQGALFPVEPKPGHHFVDVWRHEAVKIDTIAETFYANVLLDGFNQQWLGTNNEGAVASVVQFPEVLTVSLEGDLLSFSANQGDEIRLWAGRPDYAKKPVTFTAGTHNIRLLDTFGSFEGKFVIQLFQGKELLDEQIVNIKPGTARLTSRSVATAASKRKPKGMVRIPEGRFVWKITNGDEFIPYPLHSKQGKSLAIKSFFMDQHPVTNAAFKKFLQTTNYQPDDTVNFLKHWKHGQIPAGKENHPVVYIAYEDAQAYARWAGKRLPTEWEWQYAAQTPDEREWPWIEKTDKINRSTQYVTNTLTVSKIGGIDSIYCNLGSGQPDPVGAYPKGANPYGLEDLVGSVWQMTNDHYDNGAYEYVMLKGGSYYKPEASWWYVQGGPRELHYRQMWLRVSPGFERNATVGFRCVKDAVGKR